MPQSVCKFWVLVGRIIFAGILVATGTSLVRASIPQTPTSTREVVDDFGRSVRIPLAVGRIVSLAPSLTETIYALGLQDRLVGDTDYCDYPPDASKKHKVGGTINPNLEEIAALHPDIVLLTKSINRLETIRALDTLGIASYATGDPQNVDEIISSVQRLAEALGVAATGKAVDQDMQTHLAALHARLKSATPVRVLFIVWTEPLISIGKNTFIADALRMAGAQSIVDSTQSWPQTNLEEVVRVQPEYLILANAHPEEAARDFEALAALPGWRILDAVRLRHFAVVSDAVNRPAPRIVSAIEQLARQLHPEAFDEPPASPHEELPAKPDTAAPPKQLTSLMLMRDRARHSDVEGSACAR